MTRILLITALALILASCKSSQKSASQAIDYKAIAVQELGSKVEYVENISQQYVLCIAMTKAGDPAMTTYLVMDKNSGELLIPTTKVRGKVSWHDETRIAILEISGKLKENMSTPTDMTYYLDVVTKEKTSAKI